jgi:hypothetical protein
MGAPGDGVVRRYTPRIGIDLGATKISPAARSPLARGFIRIHPLGPGNPPFPPPGGRTQPTWPPSSAEDPSKNAHERYRDTPLGARWRYIGGIQSLEVLEMRYTVFGTAVLFAACSQAPQGEWRPTGDGKTIVHTITGELRETATGRTITPESVEESRRRRNEPIFQKCVIALAEADKMLGVRKDEPAWLALTKPVRTGRHFTNSELDALSDYLRKTASRGSGTFENWMSSESAGQLLEVLEPWQRAPD